MTVLLRSVALAGLLLAAAAGSYFWYQSRSDDGEVKYRLAKVERGPIASLVIASGTLNAVNTVQISAPIPGQVKEIFADFNTPVKKGQVLARLDPAAYALRASQASVDLNAAQSAVTVARSNVAARQAELGRAKAALDDAQRDLERKKMLVERKFVSPVQLDRARAAYDAAREQIKALEAQIGESEAQVQSALAAVKQRESLLRQAQADLERTAIRAPVDGTVILRNVDAGQTVAAGAQAPALFTIARDLRDMQIQAAVDEAHVGRLRVGLPARFTVDAFPRRTFSGEVRQIRKSPQKVEDAVSYTVVVSAPNSDLVLLPGMTASVRIVVDSRKNALRVPNAALRWHPLAERDTGKSRVYVLENGAPKPVGVRTGLSDGTSTELLGGLAEGSEVVVGVAPPARIEPSGGFRRLLKGLIS